ncbi:MAG: hypothetical protein PHP51_04960 [Desulfotomaculaceae bacterium]|nr:hypothetical protein [Desulfotomaculaceae bacterium]MDD4767886.1 hypothetical protein [Desulfotomaculaceae bacterium]
MPYKHWQQEEVDEPAEAKVSTPEEVHVKSLNDHRAIGVLAGIPPTCCGKTKISDAEYHASQGNSLFRQGAAQIRARRVEGAKIQRRAYYIAVHLAERVDRFR